MRTSFLAMMLLVLIAATTPPVVAHHSTMFFDVNAEIVHENVTVVEFLIANPHGVLIYVATDEDGNEVRWQAELPSGDVAMFPPVSATLTKGSE